ncbi:hypothetical protein NMY22_g6814 [Coprinellus aureogranulatus]|nr:hypothetical protein NMY22_g6814 [Coprinellus aureogranulatus]
MPRARTVMGATVMKLERNASCLGHPRQIRVRFAPSPIDLTNSTTMTTPSSPNLPAPTTPRPFPIDLLDRGEEGYYVRVQGNVLMVPKSLFDAMPSEVRHTLLISTGNGLSIHEPIELRPPMTTLQLRHLVHAFKKYSSFDIKKLPLDQLFSIAELSYQFRLARLQRWSIESIALILNSAQTPLRTADSQTFARALRIALVYGQASLSTSIQAKWLTRLHWRDLPSVPAILFADRYELRNLLGHAYYIHLIELTEPKPSSSWAKAVDITEYCRAPTTSDSPLTPAQRTHLLAGYYSLNAYWKRLRASPPPIDSDDHRCTNHDRCLAVWRLRWTVVCSKPCPPGVPDVDVLRRLKWVEDWLRRDELMRVCMEHGCWQGAIQSVARIRDEVVRNLGHHFDLA